MPYTQIPASYEAYQWTADLNPQTFVPALGQDPDPESWSKNADGYLVGDPNNFAPMPPGTWFVSQPFWGDVDPADVAWFNPDRLPDEDFHAKYTASE